MVTQLEPPRIRARDHFLNGFHRLSSDGRLEIRARTPPGQVRATRNGAGFTDATTGDSQIPMRLANVEWVRALFYSHPARDPSAEVRYSLRYDFMYERGEVSD